MIYIERTINIEDNSAYIDEPVILYKGDGNIEVRFTINNNPFKYKSGIDQTDGQLVIKRPTADPIFSNVAKLSSKLSSDKETSISIVNLVITGEMIDELVETGNYDFQIRLLHTAMSSRATLPPVTAGIIIKEPICEESVNTAPVNYSRAVINRETVDTFDEEGNYNRTTWANGDIITDKKLNKIEDALYEINDSTPTAVSQLNNDAGYLTEHQDISYLASREELPTNVSELNNDAGYTSEDYVNRATNNVRYETIKYALNLSNNKADKDHNHDEYITEHQDVSYLATKEELQRALNDVYAILDKLNRKVEVVYDESTENLSLSPEPEVIEEQLVIDEEILTYDSIEESLNIN